MTGDPYVVYRHVFRIERNHVGTVSGREPANLDSKESPRIRAGEPQGLFERNAEQRDAIAHGSGHVEKSSSECPVAPDASSVADPDFVAVELERIPVSTDRRHGIGHEHGASDP